MAQINITILGLQRIGASLGLALKAYMKSSGAQHQFTIVGSDEDRETMKTARTMGAIDQEVRDPAQAVEKAQIVLSTLPYHLTKDLFEAIGPELQPGTVVFDFSPLKEMPIKWSNQYFRKGSDGKTEAYLVGVTAMINPEYLHDARTGVDSARADMFKDGTLVISPAASCPEEAVRLATELASLLDLRTHFVDSAEHDVLMAAMESLPVLAQLALFRSISASAGWGDSQKLGNLAFSLATHRLATDEPETIGKLSAHNKESTVRALETMAYQLTELAKLIRSGDAETVAEAFSESAEKYRQWQFARTRNKWGDEPEMPNVERTNLLGNFGLLRGGKDKHDKAKNKR